MEGRAVLFGGVPRANPVATSIRIEPDRHVITQSGAIEAALGLCPRRCYALHIARCPVCTHLESAKREAR